MPLPHKPHRLCIIGDSQLGSLQTAMQTGLTAAPDGVSVEFWGATGPDFRQIHWGDGAIRASGAAKVTAQKINAAGRDHIAPEDFDTVIFFGARLRVAEFFGPYLDWAHTHGNLPSKAVLYTSAQGVRLGDPRVSNGSHAGTIGMRTSSMCRDPFIRRIFWTRP